MSRVTCTPARLSRKRRLVKVAKGYRGARSKQYKVMKETVHRGWRYAYIHRRLRKRDLRRLWILRINAAARARGISYSRFLAGLRRTDVPLDRRALSELAIHAPAAFDALVEKVRSASAA